ncbi:sugar phosphate isomerase/epimerase [Halorubrum sp. Hd13]|uniref:sugar phosphate isomerase/epimerase family protein n=1 Tax=Halorubrum sp. Hd13 TaxID=1480728 RepID=UPI000B995AFB|nr:sugar phosphate isomerase/epimerase [Halorubrum sp. Hd13]OYR41909.1 xylose isomerase [Halorubrum sp. Hd13]
MIDIAVQLYTLRSIDAPLPELLDRVGGAGYDGVEFAYRVGESPIEAVLAALDRNGLEAASAHVPIEALEDTPAEALEDTPAEALEDDFDETVDRYDRLGVDTLVVPWLDPTHFESAAAVEAVATRLNDLAAALDAQRVRLAYHNHDQEFASLDGDPAIERLIDRTDDRVELEIDAGWALVGGADPAELIDRHAGRITHVHVTDVDADRGESVALGEGDVDLDAVVASARNADVEWLVYEHDDPADPIASIERGAATLRRALR